MLCVGLARVPERAGRVDCGTAAACLRQPHHRSTCMPQMLLWPRRPIADQLAHVTSPAPHVHQPDQHCADPSTPPPGLHEQMPMHTRAQHCKQRPSTHHGSTRPDLPACFALVYCTGHPCHHVWPHISCCTIPIHHLVAQVPRLLKRLRILEFTLDHEAPYFSNMRRRTSRRDSDLNGVVDVRYTGGARMLLLLEVGSRHFKVKVRTF